MEHSLEEMGSFFDARIKNYEEHMLNEVDGMNEAYAEIAKHIPVRDGLTLVDLGCGTGLELESIFRNNPDMKIVGIDLSSEMLQKFKKKYKYRNIELHQMSYFDFEYGLNRYDAAVSCMTLHHFTHEEKLSLYKKLYEGIIEGGRYVECDYMAADQEMEDHCHIENQRLRKELGITKGFYHYDTPCTVENQIKMLYQAGFTKVEKVWQCKGTVILVCGK